MPKIARDCVESESTLRARESVDLPERVIPTKGSVMTLLAGLGMLVTAFLRKLRISVIIKLRYH